VRFDLRACGSAPNDGRPFATVLVLGSAHASSFGALDPAQYSSFVKHPRRRFAAFARWKQPHMGLAAHPHNALAARHTRGFDRGMLLAVTPTWEPKMFGLDGYELSALEMIYADRAHLPESGP